MENSSDDTNTNCRECKDCDRCVNCEGCKDCYECHDCQNLENVRYCKNNLPIEMGFDEFFNGTVDEKLDDDWDYIQYLIKEAYMYRQMCLRLLK